MLPFDPLWGWDSFRVTICWRSMTASMGWHKDRWISISRPPTRFLIFKRVFETLHATTDPCIHVVPSLDIDIRLNPSPGRQSVVGLAKEAQCWAPRGKILEFTVSQICVTLLICAFLVYSIGFYPAKFWRKLAKTLRSSTSMRWWLLVDSKYVSLFCSSKSIS